MPDVGYSISASLRRGGRPDSGGRYVSWVNGRPGRLHCGIR